MSDKFKIKVEYCYHCGYLGMAMRLTERLLDSFRAQVEELTLVEGPGGSLEVSVNGVPIHSTRQSRIYPMDERIIAKITQLIEESE